MTFDDRPIAAHRRTDSPQPDTDAPAPGFGPVSADPDVVTETTRSGKKQGSLIREIVETLLLALIIFVAVRAVVLNFRVDGLSMTPSMQDNEMLLVNRNAYASFDTWALVDWLPFVEHEETNVVYPFDPPERGDIIVFDAPVNNADKPYIKRVIALPGETFEARDGQVYIDGQPIDEPYLGGEETWCGVEESCAPVTIPDGHVLALGDNRDNSQDSRSFGPVDTDSIIGKAWVTYWPFDAAGIVPHYDYPELSERE